MAAVLGLDDEVVETVCNETKGIVVAANYNCPGQLVISGSIDAIDKACETLKEKGARRALVLPVGGAFHSPLMEPAREKLAKAIKATELANPVCAVYQNAVAKGIKDAGEIKENLIAQLTAPVKWTQSIQQMIADGGTEFIEIGPGKVLTGLMRKIDRNVTASKAEI
jgi:[acyl-carrier-protein] S-malonyltransferase